MRGRLDCIGPMRSLRFLPLAFICDVHGFAIFAPYLALFLATAHLISIALARQTLSPAYVMSARTLNFER